MSALVRLTAAREAVEEFTQLSDDGSLIDELLDAYAAVLAEKLGVRAQQAPDPYGRYHSFKEVARVLIAEIDPEAE